MTFSLLSRLINTIAPRTCLCCQRRLSLSEQFICAECNLTLPRTDYAPDFLENEVAQRFYGRLKVERAFSLAEYVPHGSTANVIYRLKYGNSPRLGEELGAFIATELQPTGFFDGITALVPVPLARRRLRQRGYNQSLLLARGISSVTHLPVVDRAIERLHFHESQTKKNYSERQKNVDAAFSLVRPELLSGQHVLLIDDVITTGATLVACGQQVAKAQPASINVLSWGIAGGKG